ncbi:MAG: hypothetical protein H0V16_02535 [Burkholderiaceae bacterium]|nr:hypothetical protein [Burkholderiaceae bacterium]
MSDKTIPPGRGGSLYEVCLLPKGINARTATNDDFVIVRVRAANAIHASIVARNEHDAACAFDPVKVQS